MKIVQDVFYNEDSLYTDGKIQELLEDFKQKGLSYEKDGAVWLKLSEMGLSEDRVIVKSSGEPTYRLPDIAYHKEKFKRGFDILVDVFGADHIATVPDVVAGVKHLGYDESKMNVVIHQFVTLTENGVQVKMSKRTGKSYTLDELLEEVGADVVRFFFIMRSCHTHLEFDLALAKEQSDKNPVFYLQYAHARCCSVIRNLTSSEFNSNIDINSLNSLTFNEHEVKLIKSMSQFESYIELAATKNEPYILVEYLKDFASNFHNFYHNCRVMDAEELVKNSRYVILETSRRILKNGLTILGITSPEKM
jgi:arginyl-tRNA synthetase